MNEEDMNRFLANQQMQESANTASNSIQQQQLYQEMEKGLAEEQLDVEGIIFNLYNLLCGNKQTYDGTRKIWLENKDNSLRILSDNGIQRMMQLITSYVNKNTMLSNHKNEEILKIMYDFTTELNDSFLMRYEDIFYTPSFKECKEILNERMKERTAIKMYANELLGNTKEKDIVEKEVLDAMEGRIEYELDKIRLSEQKKRIKEYGVLALIIEHKVLSTFRRAEGGQERSSLRRHANFSEIRAIGDPNKKDGGMFGWLK